MNKFGRKMYKIMNKLKTFLISWLFGFVIFHLLFRRQLFQNFENTAKLARFAKYLY